MRIRFWLVGTACSIGLVAIGTGDARITVSYAITFIGASVMTVMAGRAR